MSKELEAKYGKKKLRRIPIVIPPLEEGDEPEQYEFIAVRPGKSTIQAIAKAKNDEAKAGEIMVNNCIVGGDLEELEDGVVYMAVIEQLSKLFGRASGNLKKY